MQKLMIIALLAFIIVSCKKDQSNTVIPPETPIEKGKTTVLMERGIIQNESPDWTVVTMLSARASVTNPDTSVSFAMSETSPADTFVILSKGVINKKIDSTGIPIADYFWGIKAYFQKGDTGEVDYNFYNDMGYYSLIDSITLEPYRLINNTDTIAINNNYLFYWKQNYRIDTLRFKVYVKPNLQLSYDRFSTTSMSLDYETAHYDTLNRIISFTVGVPIMNSEPNIILEPFATIDFVYENDFIKVISRFFYQQEQKIGTSLLQ